MSTNKKEIVLKPGLNEEVIRKISALKKEPQWMLDIRLKAFEAFKAKCNPKWGPNLDFIDFDEYIYYASSMGEEYYKTDWNEVPQKIKDTFEKLNIPQNEAKYFSGSNSQYDSETVYHKLKKELQDKNVIFTNIETAVIEHPELVKKYFGKIIPYNDNKYAALNTAVWSGGSFVYIPKGVKLDQPLQAYFRINTKSVGQFERTLIIAEEDSYVHYNEGCTAPIYDKHSLHAAVVEVFVHKNAHARYSTIQNWSDNVLNLVTKRALVEDNAIMEWIDGNLGSKINMKYPCCILKGDNATGKTISVAVSHQDVIQDTGAKMIHLGKNTRSQIIAKSVAHNGGNATYRGIVYIGKNATDAIADVTCDTLLLDKKSKSDTYPVEKVYNKHSTLKHEAKVTDLDQQRMFYLASRGLDPATSKQLLVLGFIQPFADELPLEYTVELNRLLKLDIN
ncbi:MAG: Fe-S cluster assembly protein SufB [Mycoplasma sp.]